jgi:hypothetical protein
MSIYSLLQAMIRSLYRVLRSIRIKIFRAIEPIIKLRLTISQWI